MSNVQYSCQYNVGALKDIAYDLLFIDSSDNIYDQMGEI